MDKKQKAIFLGLWAIIILEWLGVWILIYFARLPAFISLFISIIQLILPWFIGINIIFLLVVIFTKGIEFTWEFWRDYIKELLKFSLSSFFITVLVIAASAILGTALGWSADYIYKLPIIKAIKGWGARNFY